MVVLLVLVQGSHVILHVAEHRHVFLRLLRQEYVRGPPAVAESGIAGLHLSSDLLLGVLEVMALRNGCFAGFVSSKEHVADALMSHALSIVLRAVIVYQLHLLWHLLSVAIVDIADVLSLIAKIHQRLHHFEVTLGIVFPVEVAP